MAWNDCTKEWPDDEEQVLTYDARDDGYAIAHVDAGLWYESYTGSEIDTPTHWMPLPEGPRIARAVEELTR